MKTFRPIFLLVILAAGCSGPTDANKANFQKAVDAYLEKTPACIPVFWPKGLPETIELVPKENGGGFPGF